MCQDGPFALRPAPASGDLGDQQAAGVGTGSRPGQKQPQSWWLRAAGRHCWSVCREQHCRGKSHRGAVICSYRSVCCKDIGRQLQQGYLGQAQ